jgi:6,7-dimethyl-8-ribityllumazine synthase
MGKNGFSQSNDSLNISKDCKVGVVTARWNTEITSALLAGALEELQKHLKPEQIISVQVPGTIEIPVIAKALFEKKNVDAVIALGAVIRGETTHYESVCNSVERGCTHLALEFTRPVISGVLTVENEKQAWDRLGGSHGHKGKEAGRAALEMVSLLKGL